MMMMRSGASNGGRSCPFTAAQWQELEHQALIYKYMASGAPIPADLLLPIGRSYLLLDSAAPPVPAGGLPFSLGWPGCYQMGCGGRKPEDPEPGRCRRTDGKKWRCSKEAYPDSKYCERHMHRGKNRSRKPVEMSLSTTAGAGAGTTSNHRTAPPLSSLSMSTPSETCLFSPNYSRVSGPPFHLQPHHHHHHRYGEVLESMDGNAWQFTSLGMRSVADDHRRSYGTSPPFAIDVMAKDYGEGEREQQQQHCFLLGTDLKLDSRTGDTPAKPLRSFIDEWPQKQPIRNAATGGAGNTKTQLSMSIPMAASNEYAVTD